MCSTRGSLRKITTTAAKVSPPFVQTWASQVKYQCMAVTLDNFVALWLSMPEGWREECNMFCSRVDLHHLVSQMQGRFKSKTMFKRSATAPTTESKPAAAADVLKAKEAKWGAHKEALMKELGGEVSDRLVVAYTDAKRVRGWMVWGRACAQFLCSCPGT